MAEAVTKLPVKAEKTTESPTSLEAWRPFESLHREIDRLFDEFGRDFWQPMFRRPRFDIEPIFRREMGWSALPSVDIADKENAYELTAELPGMDEKSIEVKVASGKLTIKGEKQEEKEEKKKEYYLHERRFGSFERSFRVPEGVDPDKIEAVFKKGVLTVSLPKTAEALKSEKKITVKAA
jgi:HSP20 family protein